MAISFPSNPTTNQTYTYNNKVWTFNGTRWVTSGALPTPSTNAIIPIEVGNTTPGTTANGALWVDTDTGALSVYIGGAWVLPAAGIVNLADGAVDTAAIADGAITASKIDPSLTFGVDDGAVTTAKLADGAVTAAKIAASTSYTPIAIGTTAQRPGSPVYGATRYNSTTGFPEVYTSAGWGTFGLQPPAISSVSPLSFSGEQGTSFTINGANFTSDAIVKFVTANSTEVQAATTTFVNTTQLTATTPRDFTIAEGPLGVKVVEAAGYTTKTSAIDCGVSPVWSTAAGTLSTVIYPTDTTLSTSVLATDADSGATIGSYAVTSGSLPSGLALNSATGAITGSVTDPGAASVTASFDITAYDNAGNPSSARTFSIIRKWADGSTQAQAATSASAIYSLSTNYRGAAASGKYWIKLPGQATATQVYCNMDNRLDGGGWMLSYCKLTGGGSETFKQLWYSNSAWNNTTYTADATNYPVLPNNISFGTLGFTKQMFNNQHPSWITNKGNFHWYNLQTDINWSLSGSITVNNYTLSTTTQSTTSIYNRQQAWSGGSDNLSSVWAWWADSGNGGLCGGANQCGTLACPNAGPVESCHTNGTYTTLIFVK